MKKLLYSFSLLLLVGVLVNAQDKKPNVLLIYSDDQGSLDMNCYGAKDLKTPTFDKMAENGIRFTQFYAPAPICTPSRAALLTGKSPQGAQLPNNTSSQPGHAGLPEEEVTIAEVFKGAGYNTAHIGKWHLGYTPETMPYNQGFDHSFGHMGGCIDNYSHFFYWEGPNRHDLWRNGEEVFMDGQYFPELMVDEVDQYLSSIKENEDPFFMYFAINLPHYPVQPLEKWRTYYKDLPSPRRDYAAFMSTLDEYIGKLLDVLEKQGVLENTIVVFQSDHGYSTEVRNFNGGGYSGPFRGAKGDLFEGGIRVPTLIQWPNQIPANEVRNGMGTGTDWFPTLLDFCGITYDQNAIEGHSLKEMILDKEASSPVEVFRWKFGASWAIREGDWKLIGYPTDHTKKASIDFEKDSYYLVNIAQDSSELNNLATDFPEKVEELTKKYLDWEFGFEDDLPQDFEEVQHLGFNAKVQLLQPTDKRSTGQEIKLVDGYSGTKTFSDGYWVAFLGNDMEVVLELPQIKKVKKITVGALSAQQSWIFAPQEVDIFVSEDGENYTNFGSQEAEGATKNVIVHREKITIQGKSKAKYIKVIAKNIGKLPEWHSGNGSDAYMFIDEITIE
ncbi:DUF229 domain-containing protein [Flammeovirga pectinis]|uniref:DUF229 domain-containing protein n=1 Tax=Flammeovirga pectinis TaxID=2494373 RepID=A0A3Q9FSU6_9BACT|nr:sulfatase-like hydrolase/transferase [Flammeovirga pectinis]AZQ63858.1 DUF229 domain-containing protein [Flammeovirga pectinis]